MSASSPILGLIVLLLLAVLLAVTNPPEDAHRKAIAAEYRAERPLAGAVGLGAISAVAPHYQSFVLGSYTVENDEIMSIGLLGMVWPLIESPQ